MPDLPLETWRNLAIWFGLWCLMFFVVLAIHVWRR